MLIGGAIAFSGSNFLFRKLISESKERYDHAPEKLTHERGEWIKKRQERIDFINNKLWKERNSEYRFFELDITMEVYAKANLPKLPPLGEEPKLEFNESDEENQHFREI